MWKTVINSNKAFVLVLFNTFYWNICFYFFFQLLWNLKDIRLMYGQFDVLLHTSVTSPGPKIRHSFFPVDALFRSRTVGLWYGIGIVQSYTKYRLDDIRQTKKKIKKQKKASFTDTWYFYSTIFYNTIDSKSFNS